MKHQTNRLFSKGSEPEPEHPLYDFTGLLALSNRNFGIYTGRDGPPGIYYYAPPIYLPLPDFAAMGYWRAGDTAFWTEIAPLLNRLEDTDWERLLRIFRNRLMGAIVSSMPK